MSNLSFAISFEKFLLSLNPADLPEARHLSRDFVRLYARRIAEGFTNTPPAPTYKKSVYEYKSDIYGITISSKLSNAVIARAKCKKFWTRAIEKKVNEERLAYEARNKIVGEQRTAKRKIAEPPQLYCSNKTLERDIEKKRLNEKNLSKQIVTNIKTKKSESLLVISKRNEENRAKETYHITKNLEHLAEKNNFKWLFITLTAPSMYHPNPSKGKCKYEYSAGVKASHEYIQTRWERIQSVLDRRGIPAAPDSYFGIRTVEPHKDGSIHWHILIFASENKIDNIIKAFREKFNTDTAAKIVLGRDSGKQGSAKAASYLYKYISKSLSKKEEKQSKQDQKEDAIREANDLASTRNKDRVQAAIRALRLRQYQLIGISNLKTIYTAINKINLTDVEAQPDSPLFFIKNSIWRKRLGFYSMLKNKEFFKAGGSVRLIKESTTNSYGEPIKRIVGIKIGDKIFGNEPTYRVEIVRHRTPD
ncbi:replication endonuclease [Stutzerimonas kirkiae]|uniref:replication endonuclease n=1 Tax=Stutzerimonas kirkiae TaxID=2211392 RepID=UPI0010384135|nr:replication endonuclease [Stutzerimonas kirkiae]TBV11346.1 hypothetical protein DNK08_03590 [Stutzerimonas kirkiae]